MLLLMSYLEMIRAALAKGQENGQGLAEYGLILALVAVVCILALTNLGTSILSTLGQITSSL
jgi:pilus assembly protein Flp/PilA